MSERMTARLQRAVPAGAISKGAPHRVTDLVEKAQLEGSIAAAEPREWNTEAAEKLDLTVAMLLHAEPTEDEQAALEFAHNQVAEVIEVRSADFAALANADVAWYHSTREELPGWLQSEAARADLLARVRAGLGLVLTADAILLTNDLGIEPTRPKTGVHEGHTRIEGFLPRGRQHPIFEGVEIDAGTRQIDIRMISGDETWAEPRWRTPHQPVGDVLGRPRRYNGKTLVHYQAGEGTMLAAGIPYWGAFADRTNTDRAIANLTTLTRNMLEYARR